MVYITTGTYRLVHQSKPPTRSLFFVIIDNSIVSYILENGKRGLVPINEFSILY